MSIRAKRDQLAALLDGMTTGGVHATVPEQIAPPCVVLQPADPFVAVKIDDATFGDQLAISFDVLLLVELDDEHDNEQASYALDDLLDAVIDRIAPSDWWLDSMGQPGALLTTDWISHGQRVTVQTHFPL